VCIIILLASFLLYLLPCNWRIKLLIYMQSALPNFRHIYAAAAAAAGANDGDVD